MLYNFYSLSEGGELFSVVPSYLQGKCSMNPQQMPETTDVIELLMYYVVFLYIHTYDKFNL